MQDICVTYMRDHTDLPGVHAWGHAPYAGWYAPHPSYAPYAGLYAPHAGADDYPKCL